MYIVGGNVYRKFMTKIELVKLLGDKYKDVLGSLSLNGLIYEFQEGVEISVLPEKASNLQAVLEMADAQTVTPPPKRLKHRKDDDDV